MRYNPLEPEDNTVNKEVVLLSVDLGVTPQAGASVLVKELKVDMGDGEVIPLQDDVQRTLKRYDVCTLLFRYQRYGEGGGSKTVSINATMVPLINDSSETSPQIISTWNKVLDFPRATPSSHFTAPTQRVVSQIMSPANSAIRHSHSGSITGRPQSTPKLHGRAQTVTDLPSRPPSMAISQIESPHLSITIEVPAKGVQPFEEFDIYAQVVNRSNRPIRLVLYVDSGRDYEKSQARLSRTDKVLPRIPLSASSRQSDASSISPTATETRAIYLQERQRQKGKPMFGITVETPLGYPLLSNGDINLSEPSSRDKSNLPLPLSKR